MTKNFPDSKCAADCNLIVAKCETEYLPPLGILLICSRMSSFRLSAAAGVAPKMARHAMELAIRPNTRESLALNSLRAMP